MSARLSKTNTGFSLIEILVVLVVFSIVGVIISQSILSTLRGAKRSDSESRIRSNIDYATSIMERHIRNSQTISCPASCPLGANTCVSFTDQRGQQSAFFMNSAGGNNYIASSSAALRLTNSEVQITSMTFTCVPGSGNVPPSVSITISAIDRYQQGFERAQITTSTRIMLRTNL